MTTFSFGEGFGMFDVTPLENLFIEEYMLRAPGEYVKAYIYGLKLCYHPGKDTSLKAVASALQTDEQQVAEAFAYWERQGLLRKVADTPPQYRFFNLHRVLENARPEESDNRELRDFNRSIQRLFPDRVVHGADYNRIYEWVEDLGLSRDTVLMMLSSCINGGKQRTMTYLNKVALTWAKENIRTAEAAEDHLRRISDVGKSTRTVLKQLGLRREPTMDEETLMASWLKRGFTVDAVIAACREMTKIQRPNFAYLDKVLENCAQNGQMTATDILSGISGRDALSTKTKDLMSALGVRDGGREAALNTYRTFAAQGFEHEALTAAAHYLFRRGQGTPEKLSLLLEKLAQRGLFSREDVENLFLAEENRLTAAAAEFLNAAGITAVPTDADRDFIRRIKASGIDDSTLLDAAVKSRGANNPRQYAERILSGDSERPRVGKRVSAQDYEQREYTEEQLNALFTNLLEV